MFTLPRIPGVQTWCERAAARARYSDLSVRLDETIDDLYVLDDHDERAATLERAADIAAELAALHTAAWGLEPDEAGRPMRVSLAGQAVLLRRVAATERAVVFAAWPGHGLILPGYSGTELSGACGYGAELGTWARLAHTTDPAERAGYLRSLRELAGRSLGERAAAILTVLAEIDEHRAAGSAPPPTPKYQRAWPPLALLVTLAAIVAVHGPGVITKAVLVAAVLAAAAVCRWIDHRRTHTGTAPGHHLDRHLDRAAEAPAADHDVVQDGRAAGREAGA